MNCGITYMDINITTFYKALIFKGEVQLGWCEEKKNVNAWNMLSMRMPKNGEVQPIKS